MLTETKDFFSARLRKRDQGPHFWTNPWNIVSGRKSRGVLLENQTPAGYLSQSCAVGIRNQDRTIVY